MPKQRDEMWLVFFEDEHWTFSDYYALLTFCDDLEAGRQKYRIQEVVTTREVIFDNTGQP